MSTVRILPLCQRTILLSWVWKSKSISKCQALWTPLPSCLGACLWYLPVHIQKTPECAPFPHAFWFPFEGKSGTPGRKAHCIHCTSPISNDLAKFFQATCHCVLIPCSIDPAASNQEPHSAAPLLPRCIFHWPCSVPESAQVLSLLLMAHTQASEH